MSEDVIVPVRSRGYVTQPTDEPWSFYSDLESEHVPDLLWPYSVDVYERMRKDPQVASIARAVQGPLLKTRRRLDPQDARPDVVDLVAKDLGLPVIGQPKRPPSRRKGRFSFREHVRLALTSFWLGVAFFEQEAVYNPDDRRAHLHRLGFRPLKTLAEPPKVARDGGLVSIKQNGISNEPSREIPVRQLVAYVHQREGGNWLGRSVLRPAYQPYLLRDRLVRTDTISHDRFGVGTPTYTSGDPEGRDLAKGEELMKSLRSGEEGGLSLPKDAKAEILVPMGAIPDTLKSIEYHDRKIAGTLVGHVFNLGQQSGTGSYALGMVQQNQFTESLESFNDEIDDVTNAHVVEDLVDWNWGPNEPCPRIVSDPISEKWTAQMLKFLVDAGILRPDRQTEEWIRQGIDAPPKDQPQEAA